jgi:TonB family protein
MMARYRGLFVASVFLTATLPRGFSQSPQSPESSVTMRRAVARSCELLQKAQLEIHEGYVALRADDVGGEIYSPELGKEDLVEYSAATPAQAVKLTEKSGFHVKPISSAEGSDLPKVVGSENSATCPTVEKALQIAEQDRIDRRHQVQSKKYKAGKGVSPPEALESGQQTPVGGASLQQTPPKPTDSHAATEQSVVSAVVAANGDVEDIRVLNASSPEVARQAAQEAATWKFKPGRKNGLPVPVVITVEVDTHYH